jgi:SAM-dependent methyltransferase
MNSRHTGVQPPTAVLPPLRTLDSVAMADVSAAVANLRALYAPLPRAAGFAASTHGPQRLDDRAVDSGYASADEDEDAPDPDVLRADPLERAFAIKWLTGFIARVDTWAPPYAGEGVEDARERLMDEVTALLAAFSDPGTPTADDDDTAGAPLGAVMRRFAFPVGLAGHRAVELALTDAPLLDTDHTAVGLQSWGASIVLGELQCTTPARFGLAVDRDHSSAQPLRVLELGAGTGVLSMVAAQLLGAGALVVATDFHPAVLENLSRNMAANAPGVLVRALDWADPDALASELPASAPGVFDVLLAADVVYAPEHAALLRACAARWLAPAGTFWLAATVRPEGRFAGVVDTVRAAFADEAACAGDMRALRIRSVEEIGKKRGVGRADEVGYRLFEIGWSSTDNT